MTLTFEDTYRNLRLTSASVLAEYLANTQLWRSVGNAVFADLIRHHAAEPFLPKARPVSPFRKDFVIFHSWLPGMYEISGPEADVVGQLISNLHPGNNQRIAAKLIAELKKRGWCRDAPIDLDALVSQAIEVFAAIQNPRELKEFFAFVSGFRPRVVVEIGTARGGVLYGLSQLASTEALLISIDLPGGRNCGGQTEIERELFKCFGPRTQEFHFIPQDSRSEATEKALQMILNSREIDLLFIDGDHSYGAVRSDFETYGKFVADGGIIALHDICMMPEEWGPSGQVGVFWAELARQYETRTIIDPNGVCKRQLPRGVEWSWGIGILEKRTDWTRNP